MTAPTVTRKDAARMAREEAVIAATLEPAVPGSGVTERSLDFDSMGGSVRLMVACALGAVSRADRDLRLVAARIQAWAARLTRFSQTSDLSALNHHPEAGSTQLRPMLAAVLEASAGLEERSDGLVDITLLEARLAAEDGTDRRPDSGRWWLEGSGRSRRVRREGRIVFDLDGVGKGWIADRALALLADYPAALVDADGDVALRLAPGVPWRVAVADPRVPDVDLAVLRVPSEQQWRRLGIATSGTSIHRWPQAEGTRHHLIDPRTGQPADTDLRQVTVVAESALVAEALAKAAVIAGAATAPELLEQAGALAEVLLPVEGEAYATLRSLEWLA
jgi:thiamine biosynthesis lipoprotein